jgi:hypothetical protein
MGVPGGASSAYRDSIGDESRSTPVAGLIQSDLTVMHEIFMKDATRRAWGESPAELSRDSHSIEKRRPAIEGGFPMGKLSLSMSDTGFGPAGLWFERCSVRSYEGIVYAWLALVGGLWGWSAMATLFVYEPSKVMAWVAFWPALLALQLPFWISTELWPFELEAAIFGVVGVCLTGYVFLTVSHLRE